MKVMVSPSGVTHVGYGDRGDDGHPTVTHCGRSIGSVWTVAADQTSKYPTCRSCLHAAVAAPHLRGAIQPTTPVVTEPDDPPRTNQGTPTIGQALDIVAMADIEIIAAALWLEIKSHGLEPTRGGAGCECVAIEAIARLLAMGYRIEAPDADPEG